MRRPSQRRYWRLGSSRGALPLEAKAEGSLSGGDHSGEVAREIGKAGGASRGGSSFGASPRRPGEAPMGAGGVSRMGRTDLGSRHFEGPVMLGGKHGGANAIRVGIRVRISALRSA